MRKIILASASPRRKELLESIRLQFKVVKSNFEERMNPRLGPRSQAEFLSKEKATVVAKKHHDAIVIGADVIVALDNEIFGKPKNTQDAKRTLTKLQGKKHQVITAFTIIDTATKKSVTKSVVTHVFMKKLAAKEIDSFLKKIDVSDFAGAYTIQGIGAVLIEKIEGDYTNVVGLPIFALAQLLRKFKINIL